MSEIDSTLSLGGGGGVSGESLESKSSLGGGGGGGGGVVSGESSDLDSKSILGGGGVSGESSKLESKDEKWKGMTLTDKIKILADDVLTQSEHRALMLDVKKDKPFLEDGFDIDDNGVIKWVRPYYSDTESEYEPSGNYDWGAWDAELKLEDPDFEPDEDMSCWDEEDEEEDAKPTL